jgi:aspartate ammonia-lyase
VEHSIGVVTALNPLLGYEIATDLAAEALKTGKGIVELVRQRKLLSEEEIRIVLDPKSMTGIPRAKAS